MGMTINIPDNYDGYIFMGYAQGQFEDQQGQQRPYYNMYVFSPVSSYQSDDYQAFGWKCEKKKCLDADVWKDLTPGDPVKLFFDDKNRVVMVALA